MLRNAPNQLETLCNEHRSLAVLRTLFRLPAYTSNELLLSDWLTAVGLSCCSSDLRCLLRKLEEAELLTTKDVDGTLVAELSNKGAEVAEGRIVVEGVLRAAPECPY